MENRQDQNSDPSKSQSEQNPNQLDRSQENRQSTEGELDQKQSQTETGQDGAPQSDTKIDPRSGTDESASPATDTGFVGAEGQSDTSSELVEEDDPDFSKGGQGSIE